MKKYVIILSLITIVGCSKQSDTNILSPLVPGDYGSFDSLRVLSARIFIQNNEITNNQIVANFGSRHFPNQNWSAGSYEPLLSNYLKIQVYNDSHISIFYLTWDLVFPDSTRELKTEIISRINDTLTLAIVDTIFMS